MSIATLLLAATMLTAPSNTCSEEIIFNYNPERDGYKIDKFHTEALFSKLPAQDYRVEIQNCENKFDIKLYDVESGDDLTHLAGPTRLTLYGYQDYTLKQENGEPVRTHTHVTGESKIVYLDSLQTLTAEKRVERNGHWYAAELHARGVIASADIAEDTLTRAEFATILAKMLNIKPDVDSQYSDLEYHEAQGYINAMTKAGYFQGEHGVFKPNQKVTVKQANDVMRRIAKDYGLTFQKLDRPQINTAADTGEVYQQIWQTLELI